MAAQTETIREYLVNVGFNVDEQDVKKLDNFISNVHHKLAGLGKELAGTAIVVGISVNKIAGDLNDLYFQSLKTGTAASSLKAFAFAAQQVGISAGTANSAVESFTENLRKNPGIPGHLQTLGLDPNQQDKALLMLQAVQKLQEKYGYSVGSNVASSMLGENHENYQGLTQQADDYIKQYRSHGSTSTTRPTPTCKSRWRRRMKSRRSTPPRRTTSTWRWSAPGASCSPF